ncbi:MAG: glycosyltransferase family 2 protein [Candidatus Komeilibacteria bacterium]|nr:glycosyltransferase family 2 protein [Candidatus Komeilibacteria bacterium]
MTRIAVIIINWNGYEDTRECLRSLTQCRTDSKIDVLVIDNYSTDRTEIMKLKKEFPDISTFRNAWNRGFTGANNQGFRWALERQTDYVLILNNDTVVEKDFLDLLLHTARRYDKCIIGPKIIFYKSRKLQNTGGKFSIFHGGRSWHKNKNAGEYTKMYRPDFLSGCCWLMPIRALNEVGYFDDHFFAYAEDVDYSFRARSAGYQLIVDGRSSIYHKHSASTRGSCIKQYYRARNTGYLLKKYHYALFVRWVSLLTLGLIVIIHNRHLGCLKEFIRGARAPI